MRGIATVLKKNNNNHQTSDPSEFSGLDAQRIILDAVYHSVISHVVFCTWSYLEVLWKQNERHKYQAWLAHINDLLTREAAKPKAQQLFTLSPFPINGDAPISNKSLPTVTLQLAAIRSLDLTVTSEEKLMQDALAIEACFLATLHHWLACNSDPYPAELSNKLQNPTADNKAPIKIERNSVNTTPAIKLTVHFRDQAAAIDFPKDPDTLELYASAKENVVHFFTRAAQKKTKLQERPRVYLDILRLIHSIGMNNGFWLTQHHDYPKKNHKKIPISVAAIQECLQSKKDLSFWLDPNLNVTDYLETQNAKQLKDIEGSFQAILDNLRNKTHNKSETPAGCFGFFFKAFDFSEKLHRRSLITQSFYNALQNTKELPTLLSELQRIQKKITNTQNQTATPEAPNPIANAKI